MIIAEAAPGLSCLSLNVLVHSIGVFFVEACYMGHTVIWYKIFLKTEIAFGGHFVGAFLLFELRPAITLSGLGLSRVIFLWVYLGVPRVSYSTELMLS